MSVVQEFETYLESQKRSALTVKGYITDIKQFIGWFERTKGEAFGLPAVTPTDIRQYRQHMLSVENHKAATINRHLAAVSALMAWAIQRGIIFDDPTLDVHSIPIVNTGPKYLDKQQQFALQSAIENDLRLSRLRYPKRWRARQRDASLVNFMMNTGLRLQEALDLRLSDLEIDECKGHVLVRRGEGSKQRSVPLNNEARNALHDWLKIRPTSDDDYVWVAVEGEQVGSLSSRAVQRAILRIGQDAGFVNLTPHQLRHTFGKNLVDSGVGLETVAALLGHANLNTTRIYITPNKQDLEQAVDKLSLHE